MNLLTETRDIIEKAGKTPEDIVFIGSVYSGHACTWEEFETLADVTYNAGYGAAEVAVDLVVIFGDRSYLDRQEYDGLEWWKYNAPLTIPTQTKPIRVLTGGLWRDLAELNDPESD